MDPRVAAVIGVMRESLIERVSVATLSRLANIDATAPTLQEGNHKRQQNLVAKLEVMFNAPGSPGS
jgi:hypothetical protein